jgi:hypothetical protein
MNYYEKYLKYKMKYMILKGSGSPPFEFNNTLDFFKKRLSDHHLDLDLKLETLLNEIKKTNDPIITYNNIMDQIKSKVGFNINWDKLPTNQNELIKLWSYREYIVSITFETTHRIFSLNKGKSIKIFKELRNISSDNSKNSENSDNSDNASAAILGSTTLLSDIDITVISNNASLWIAIIEDLWEQTNWFDHSLWKVDLYGDFTMIGEYYIDTRFFNKDIMIQLLELAVVSYFKHDNSNKFNNELLNKLINWCINNNGLLTSTDDIITIAKNKALTLKSASRELYYEKLSNSEKLQHEIKSNLKSTKLDKNQINNLLGQVMISLGEANLYREENYILPSTVIHIVRCEQAKESGDSCAPIILKSACCSLGSFVYILSAVEQLGYLLHNLEHDKVICNLPAGKYFGRLIRAINKASISQFTKMVEEKQSIKDLLKLSDNLMIIKKERGDKGDADKTCPNSPDLYKLISDLF